MSRLHVQIYHCKMTVTEAKRQSVFLWEVRVMSVGVISLNNRSKVFEVSAVNKLSLRVHINHAISYTEPIKT